MSSKQLSKRERRREEQRIREEEQRRAAQRKRTILTSVIAIVAVLLGVSVIIFLINRTPTASSSNNANSGSSQALDNIRCDSSEQLNYHVHAHLSIYVNGQPVQVAQNIGITNTCFYWLHTHDTSGVIHIESPQQATFTLGTFLNLWKVNFSQLQYPFQLDDTQGWQVYVNGKPYSGDFNKIPLDPHNLITLAYNSPGIKPDTVYAWNGL